MPADLSALEVALLALAALVAGTVDAVAGGGGLVTLPSLLAAGLPPHLALGTNKGQGVFGTFASLAGYARKGLVGRDLAPVTFPLGLAGAFGGAALVLLFRPEVLQPLVLALLVAAAFFLTFRPKAIQRPSPAPRARARTIAGVAALAIGAYDGFFGPGTGTFLILASTAFLGMPLLRASAEAKVVNFASNLGAVVLFAARGAVIWRIALPMAAAQLLGGFLGAHLAARGGDRFIRIAVLAVVLALVAKLALDLLG